MHPRGIPDTVTITIERLARAPRSIAALPVLTLDCASLATARKHITSVLATLGVSEQAIRSSLAIVNRPRAMRGAALVSASSGTRLDSDRSRGVRASRLGISPAAGRELGRKLGRIGLNTVTVTEALVLASKVASADGVLAELCVSDDPDYTTGYVASRRFGYLRVPHIKQKGSRSGGRVIFLDGSIDAGRVSSYLESEPVLISRISACSGTKGIDEIIGRHH